MTASGKSPPQFQDSAGSSESGRVRLFTAASGQLRNFSENLSFTSVILRLWIKL
jgi:hypothetical protein